MSSNRQIGLPADFARALGATPDMKLLETLVELPGGGWAVLVTVKPASHAAALAASLEGIAPEGADRYVSRLRAEWRRR